MNQQPVWQGLPYPLGASLMADGVNFALFSENATGVDLCLFETADAPREAARIRLTEQTDHVWHCFLPGLKAGQLYGYRVFGPWEPKAGHRFNPAKLLIDPYARAIAGEIEWSEEMYGFQMSAADHPDLVIDPRDNAAGMPKCVVVDNQFEWDGDRQLATPLHRSVIYEAHVKGFSQQCPAIPEELRGSYAALGSAFAVEYFQKLGVTAIELLPVHHFVNDDFLAKKGLTNYWGYNSIGYFAPHASYSSSGVEGGQVAEFKQMVKNLHTGGIEVILDVVYNHTAEGHHLGPTLCLRGLDNASYHRLSPTDRRYYVDYTGCGNTLNMMHPRVLQLIMDSLRYWVLEMHVDGFRFDLASTLARELHDVDKLGGFFDIIHQDPVLSQVKLIAEPWDIGEGGYQVGNFPVLWAEWNGKYRDCVRGFWKGDEHVSEFAYRLTGSSDLYQHDGRRPYASINFIIAHDGFTLADLVSYNEKHNTANLEENRDGDNHGRSWNCGIEGPTDDPEINALRRRQQRNFLATLFLSQGVPMLCGGDEYGRTQCGNNNAYCQDSPLSWLAWERSEEQQQRQRFVEKLIHFRHAHPNLRRPKFFQTRESRSTEAADLLWFTAEGLEMTDEDWNLTFHRCLGVVLVGFAEDVRDYFGQPIHDETFMLLFNAHHDPVKFVLPGRKKVAWERVLDTANEDGFLAVSTPHHSGEELPLLPRSLSLFKLRAGTPTQARTASWKLRPALPH